MIEGSCVIYPNSPCFETVFYLMGSVEVMKLKIEN